MGHTAVAALHSVHLVMPTNIQHMEQPSVNLAKPTNTQVSNFLPVEQLALQFLPVTLAFFETVFFLPLI